MNMQDRIRLFDQDAQLLELAANQYAEDSKEYAAIKHATIALWYVLREQYEPFRSYVTKFQGDLTADQRAHLVALGIDPDADPDDL